MPFHTKDYQIKMDSCDNLGNYCRQHCCRNEGASFFVLNNMILDWFVLVLSVLQGVAVVFIGCNSNAHHEIKIMNDCLMAITFSYIRPSLTVHARADEDQGLFCAIFARE
jgi:hypothetical protein